MRIRDLPPVETKNIRPYARAAEIGRAPAGPSIMETAGEEGKPRAPVGREQILSRLATDTAWICLRASLVSHRIFIRATNYKESQLSQMVPAGLELRLGEPFPPIPVFVSPPDEVNASACLVPAGGGKWAAE